MSLDAVIRPDDSHHNQLVGVMGGEGIYMHTTHNLFSYQPDFHIVLLHILYVYLYSIHPPFFLPPNPEIQGVNRLTGEWMVSNRVQGQGSAADSTLLLSHIQHKSEI